MSTKILEGMARAARAIPPWKEIGPDAQNRINDDVENLKIAQLWLSENVSGGMIDAAKMALYDTDNETCTPEAIVIIIKAALKAAAEE